ncbi:WD repeat-containing protein 1-like [Liolophura sinensis]|uniref:WD repeat-containing protein 1-like n=1 Tax=Liolophura sinensis TaxID=3198878 RepID=UPI0031580198
MGDTEIVPKCIFAALPRTERGRAIVISPDPKNKNYLYTNGNSVYIRDIENPAISDVYTQHPVQVLVAKYAPSGFYIASGDSRGKIRIWDTTQRTHLLKYEYQPLGGSIRDIAWSPDSKRIAVVGDGREKYASVFLWDTGSSVGSMEGHSKLINSVDYKPTRPYRTVTASEDFRLCFYEGPPFKYKHSMSDHTAFVNCVRYSPDGEKIISGGSDGKAFVYDGKSGERVGELGSPAHKGGIYAVSFSPDSSQVLTASGDKSAKIFDVASGECVVVFPMGTDLEYQQLGCLWQGEYMLTVSLNGQINYLDRNNPSKPLRVIKGHSKPITAMCIPEDKSTIYTASSDALINYWDPVTGECESIKGKGHSNQVQDMVISDGVLITVSMDDTIRFTQVDTKEYGTDQVKLDSQPKAVAAAEGGLAVVACISEVVVFQNKRKVFTQKVPYEPSSVAIHPGKTEVVVGGGQKDMAIHVYELNNNTLVEKTDVELKMGGQITDLKYSPDGAYLASCDTNRRLTVFKMPSYEQFYQGTHHTARINSVAWTSDSAHLVTGSLDTNIIVWNMSKMASPYVIRSAHLQSNITRVAWITDNTVVSVAQDSTVRQWDIAH